MHVAVAGDCVRVVAAATITAAAAALPLLFGRKSSRHTAAAKAATMLLLAGVHAAKEAGSGVGQRGGRPGTRCTKISVAASAAYSAGGALARPASTCRRSASRGAPPAPRSRAHACMTARACVEASTAAS